MNRTESFRIDEIAEDGSFVRYPFATLEAANSKFNEMIEANKSGIAFVSEDEVEFKDGTVILLREVITVRAPQHPFLRRLFNFSFEGIRRVH